MDVEMDIAEVRYEHKDGMRFIGFTESIRSGDCYQKSPVCWEEFCKIFNNLLQNRNPENPLEKAVLENDVGTFAVCSNRSDVVEYTIAGLYKGGEVPEGMNIIAYPASNWAIFTVKGPLPQSLQQLNRYIHDEWMPTKGKELGALSVLNIEWYNIGDVYTKDYECGVWVPIAIIPAE